jgi:hypothetical protein
MGCARCPRPPSRLMLPLGPCAEVAGVRAFSRRARQQDRSLRGQRARTPMKYGQMTSASTAFQKLSWAKPMVKSHAANHSIPAPRMDTAIERGRRSTAALGVVCGTESVSVAMPVELAMPGPYDLDDRRSTAAQGVGCNSCGCSSRSWRRVPCPRARSLRGSRWHYREHARHQGSSGQAAATHRGDPGARREHCGLNACALCSVQGASDQRPHALSMPGAG